MGIKSTLSNIEYLQEQREQREISEKEEREIEKNYKKTLKDTIKYYFKDIFDTCKDIEYQYNDFILNNTTHINNIITILNEESQKNYKIIIDYTWEKGQEDWKRVKKAVYLWDDYDIEQDIQENYYKILKQQYDFYKQEETAKKYLLLEKVKNEINYMYQKYGYNVANKTLYDYNMDHEFSQDYAKNSKEYLFIKENYYKILGMIDTQYKRINKTQEPPKAKKRATQKRQKTLIEQHAGLVILGATIHGINKGLKNTRK